jgi:hypothetical protein
MCLRHLQRVFFYVVKVTKSIKLKKIKIKITCVNILIIINFIDFVSLAK